MVEVPSSFGEADIAPHISLGDTECFLLDGQFLTHHLEAVDEGVVGLSIRGSPGAHVGQRGSSEGLSNLLL